MYKFRINIWRGLLLLPLLTACNDASGPVGNTPLTAPLSGGTVTVANEFVTHTKPMLDVYKSPTCGCCRGWIAHIDEFGLQSAVHDMAMDDLSVLKNKKGIQPQYQSCHTAVTAEGYVFEGHIPARYIRQFLIHPPEDAIGLAVPAMPVGSPGMEMGDQFRPYRVLLLKRGGGSEVFASVEIPEQQYGQE